ncbi:MAG: DUF692 family protein [Candidatus Hydrogenedentes bacterium]|nr:DUF692 family protein [Candidatus Hydrogenedentota bacterium]
MRFAINYSPQAAALLQQNEIAVDCFKCPDWPEAVAEAGQHAPAYVHFPFRAGTGDVESLDMAKVLNLLEISDTPYLNVHLSPRASLFDNMPLDTQRPQDREQLLNAIQRDVQAFTALFPDKSIILENVMWAPDPPWEIPLPALDPELIHTVVEDSGQGFLLDLAHAAISADFLGIDRREYIQRLPLHRLRELHAVGIIVQPDGSQLDHFPMGDRDWELLAWALREIGAGRWPEPWVLAFEYGGVGPGYDVKSLPEVIRAQAPRMSALIQRIVSN